MLLTRIGDLENCNSIISLQYRSLKEVNLELVVLEPS